MVGSTFFQSLIAVSFTIPAVWGRSTPYSQSSSSISKRLIGGWPTAIFPEVMNSSSSNFAVDTARWSSFQAPTFDSLFLPKSEADLSAALSYLTANNITFLTKSGGHGYSSTLQVVQNAVLINMQNFNYTKINNDSTVTVGSGMLFNDMIQIVAAAGREMTVGSCPCVGAIGATLGGGVGRLQGLHGLTSDAVTKFRMALWNGTIIDVSNTQHSDLFWGMRGAGQNFGVVIEITYNTFPATNNGVNYQADFTFPLENVTAVIKTYNSLVPIEPNLSLILGGAIDPTSLTIIPILNLIYMGPQSKGRKYTNLFSKYSNSLVESNLTWAQLPNLASGGVGPANCINGGGNIDYPATMKTLDAPSFVDFYNDFQSFVQANPASNGSAFIVETFAQQGVNKSPDNFSAFPHRGQINHLMQIDMKYFDDTSFAAAEQAFAKKWRDHFSQPSISGYPSLITYQNYGHGDEAPSALYGVDQWRHQRLTALKNSYDPHRFFDAYHAIPRTLASWT